jgi:hypothetical protein
VDRWPQDPARTGPGGDDPARQDPEMERDHRDGHGDRELDDVQTAAPARLTTSFFAGHLSPRLTLSQLLHLGLHMNSLGCHRRSLEESRKISGHAARLGPLPGGTTRSARRALLEQPLLTGRAAIDPGGGSGVHRRLPAAFSPPGRRPEASGVGRTSDDEDAAVPVGDGTPSPPTFHGEMELRRSEAPREPGRHEDVLHHEQVEPGRVTPGVVVADAPARRSSPRWSASRLHRR